MPSGCISKRETEDNVVREVKILFHGSDVVREIKILFNGSRCQADAFPRGEVKQQKMILQASREEQLGTNISTESRELIT